MKAIFLDRDGTIVIDKNYISKPEQLEWLPHAVNGLKLLQAKGYEFFLVTNQSGIGRGFFSLNDLHAVHQSLNQMMQKAGLQGFRAIEFCPHDPKDLCTCRKPKSGMIQKIIQKYPIDLAASWMIGDKDIDAQCGIHAGLKPAIVGSTYQAWAKQNQVPCFSDLQQFAQQLK